MGKVDDFDFNQAPRARDPSSQGRQCHHQPADERLAVGSKQANNDGIVYVSTTGRPYLIRAGKWAREETR